MPIAIALILSSLLHVTAIVMPGWELPESTALPPSVIEAHLGGKVSTTLAPRSSIPRPPRRVSVGQESFATPQPAAEIAPLPLAPTLPAPAELSKPPIVETPVVEDPISEEPVVEKQLPLMPPPWAGRGQIRYLVFYGENSFMIGEAIHEWTVEEGRYSLKSTAEPKGLAALRGKVRRQSSEGDITATGLRPRIFRDQREGREADIVTFDWEARRATFTNGRAPVVLVEEAQDMLSVFYQLAWHQPSQTIDLPVATAGRMGRMTFTWVGKESLVLSAGSVPTLHLRAQQSGSAEATDVWLAPSLDGLPVKIRHTDKKGEIWEQIAQ
ncbi:MAG: DUF3108 domain-containing protein [Rhodocyclaceae bacterium]|nr:DUF3108 domain-containing protein [Rhodocyclaceae bacterium]